MPALTAEKKPAAESPNGDRANGCSHLEAEVIGLFVQISRMLGQPRSYGEIYGLIFISARPLAMDEIMERLGISKGSASQGLRFLRKAGAVNFVYIPGDRRIHYEAVAELRHLVLGFLRDQILPQLEATRNRLDEIAESVRKLPGDERQLVTGRITMLQSWAKKSRKFLPVVVKILEV